MARRRLRTGSVASAAEVVVLLLAVALYYVIQRGKLGSTRLATNRTLLTLLSVMILALHKKLGFRQVALFREVGWKFESWVDVAYLELLLGD